MVCRETRASFGRKYLSALSASGFGRTTPARPWTGCETLEQRCLMSLSHAVVTATPAAIPQAVVVTTQQVSAVEGQYMDLTVGSFTVSNAVAIDDLEAIIVWGDGNRTDIDLGSFAGGGSGTTVIPIHATHYYMEEGKYQTFLEAEVDDPETFITDSTNTFNVACVADAPLCASRNQPSLSAVEGKYSDQIVATFFDTDPLGDKGDYCAIITWGNGQQTVGQITTDPINPDQDGNPYPIFQVRGQMTYIEAGTYCVSVKIVDEGGACVNIKNTLTVADAPLTSTSVSFSPTEGIQIEDGTVVAAFEDANPFATVSDFTATINWGDGHIGAGTVIVNPNPDPICPADFLVTGCNTYSEAGAYQVTVTIVDEDGSITSTTQFITVQDAPLYSQGNDGLQFENGQWESGLTIATFQDANPLAWPHIDDYSVTINWGDGSSSSTGSGVSITTDWQVPGNFNVVSGHRYTGYAQSHVITVTITDDDGAVTTAYSLAVIWNPTNPPVGP